MNSNKSIGYCVKSKEWTVRWQSEECLATCGKKIDSVCRENCRKWSKDSPNFGVDGAQVFKNRLINGVHFDVVVIESEEEILSVLCPVEKAYQENIEYFKSQGFTPREVEVMMLKKEGLSHKEIRDRLFISESTLKTHIHNARLKLSLGLS